MKVRRTGTGLLVVVFNIALVVAAPAAAEEVVPPGNSAVNQYTEPFPTAGGNRDANTHRGRDLNPGKVIGEKNAKALDEQGETGRETAELAAETAPNVVPSESTTGSGDESSGSVAGGSGRD